METFTITAAPTPNQSNVFTAVASAPNATVYNAPAIAPAKPIINPAPPVLINIPVAPTQRTTSNSNAGALRDVFMTRLTDAQIPVGYSRGDISSKIWDYFTDPFSPAGINASNYWEKGLAHIANLPKKIGFAPIPVPVKTTTPVLPSAAVVIKNVEVVTPNATINPNPIKDLLNPQSMTDKYMQTLTDAQLPFGYSRAEIASNVLTLFNKLVPLGILDNSKIPVGLSTDAYFFNAIKEMLSALPSRITSNDTPKTQDSASAKSPNYLAWGIGILAAFGFVSIATRGRSHAVNGLEGAMQKKTPTGGAKSPAKRVAKRGKIIHAHI